MLLNHYFSFATSTVTARCVCVRPAFLESRVKVYTFVIQPTLHSTDVDHMTIIFTALYLDILGVKKMGSTLPLTSKDW